MWIDARVARRLPVAALLLAVGCASASTRPLSEGVPASRPQRIEIASKAIRLDGETRGDSSAGVPESGGVIHTLMPGQTLYAVARAYHVPLETLMRVNGIADPRSIPDRKPLFIPGALRPLDISPTFTPASGRTAAEPSERSSRPAELASATMLDLPGASLPRPGIGGPGMGPGDRPGLPAPPSLELAWPLRGTITSRFGTRGRRAHHEGVDIDGVSGEGILAAAAGTVVRAGKEGGYGRLIVIDHGRGITTLYAHASRLLVREGDRVEAGEAIAEVGRSGNARGSHLHFEIHRNGRPVDPLPLLKTGSVPATDLR